MARQKIEFKEMDFKEAYRRIVEVLSKYDIRHTDAPICNDEIEGSSCGVCDYERREIWISNRDGYLEQLDTVIHEVMHASHNERGEKQSEDLVVLEAKNLWKRILE